MVKVSIPRFKHWRVKRVWIRRGARTIRFLHRTRMPASVHVRLGRGTTRLSLRLRGGTSRTGRRMTRLVRRKYVVCNLVDR